MRTDKQLESLAVRLAFRTPPVKWEKTLEKLTAAERTALSRKLDGLCGAAALAAGYVGARASGVLPTESQRVMNRRTRQVRKALGYHTTHDLTF